MPELEVNQKPRPERPDQLEPKAPAGTAKEAQNLFFQAAADRETTPAELVDEVLEDWENSFWENLKHETDDPLHKHAPSMLVLTFHDGQYEKAKELVDLSLATGHKMSQARRFGVVLEAQKTEPRLIDKQRGALEKHLVAVEGKKSGLALEYFQWMEEKSGGQGLFKPIISEIKARISLKKAAWAKNSGKDTLYADHVAEAAAEIDAIEDEAYRKLLGHEYVLDIQKHLRAAEAVYTGNRDDLGLRTDLVLTRETEKQPSMRASAYLSLSFSVDHIERGDPEAAIKEVERYDLFEYDFPDDAAMVKSNWKKVYEMAKLAVELGDEPIAEGGWQGDPVATFAKSGPLIVETVRALNIDWDARARHLLEQLGKNFEGIPPMQEEIAKLVPEEDRPQE